MKEFVLSLKIKEKAQNINILKTFLIICQLKHEKHLEKDRSSMEWDAEEIQSTFLD